VVAKEDHKFYERGKNGREKVIGSSEKGVIEEKAREGDNGLSETSELKNERKLIVEGAAEMRESGNGDLKDELVEKAKTNHGIEKKIGEEENKIEREDGPAVKKEKLKREERNKIYMIKGEIDENEKVEDKNKALDVKKIGQVKESDEKNHKRIMVKIENANEMKQDNGEAFGNVNKKEFPENEPIEKAEPEQKEACKNMAGDNKALGVKGKESGKMVKDNEPGLVEGNRVKADGKKVTTNGYSDGELMFKIDT